MSTISTSNTADFDEQARQIYSSEQVSADDIFNFSQRILTSNGQFPDLGKYKELVRPHLVEPNYHCFGISLPSACEVFGYLSSVIQTPLQLVGHVNPDYDCLASMIMMEQVIRHLKGSATIHAHEGNIDSITARTPQAASKFRVESLPLDSTQGHVIMLDAIDPYASNVRLSEDIVPYLILDNHFGEMKAKNGIFFPRHVALSTAIAGILIYSSTEEHFDTPEFSVQAALAILAMYTDSGEFMRANEYDSEALKVLLPFADRGILEEFASNSIEQEAITLVKSLRPHKAATRDVFLFAAHLPALSNRDLGGAAADLIMRYNPSLSACLLTSPEMPLDIKGKPYEQTRGFLRVRSVKPDSPEILSLAEATFNGNTFGARGLEVAGGVARRIKAPDLSGRPRFSLASQMIERFLLKGLFPKLTIQEIADEM